VSRNTELPPQGRQSISPSPDAPTTTFTLRDLYVRASISGNSMAAELGRYLNIDESTFSKSSKEIAVIAEPSVHEQALSAILEVVTANATPPSQYVRTPAPQGGVQEWWARMISGSINNTSSATGCPSIGESE
jgi:hypothetical protein